MKTKTSIIKKVLYILIPLVLIAILVIKLKKNKEITQSKIYQYNKEVAVNVKADTLQMESIRIEHSHSGTFEPNKETKISAEIQGKINEVLVDVGDIVSKGQVLIQLDNTLLKLQEKTIEVQIEGFEKDVKRYNVLTNADAIQGVQLEKAELGLKSAKLQRDGLLEQINKTTIKAPFNGVITAKLSEVGAFAAPGVPLLQLTDITSLKFTITIAENELSKFSISKNYSIVADAYPDYVMVEKTIMIGSKANMANSYPIQFIVKNTSDLKIKSGMFGKVIVKNEAIEKGIVIPASAIIGSINNPRVYLIKNGKSILQNITILRKMEDKIIVSEGLVEGDVIITNGFINLFDSSNVIVN